jgi:hypothetical protein
MASKAIVAPVATNASTRSAEDRGGGIADMDRADPPQVWPSRRMVSTMLSEVSGLTKHEAPSTNLGTPDLPLLDATSKLSLIFDV